MCLPQNIPGMRRCDENMAIILFAVQILLQNQDMTTAKYLARRRAEREQEHADVLALRSAGMQSQLDHAESVHATAKQANAHQQLMGLGGEGIKENTARPELPPPGVAAPEERMRLEERTGHRAPEERTGHRAPEEPIGHRALEERIKLMESHVAASRGLVHLDCRDQNLHLHARCGPEGPGMLHLSAQPLDMKMSRNDLVYVPDLSAHDSQSDPLSAHHPQSDLPAHQLHAVHDLPHHAMHAEQRHVEQGQQERSWHPTSRAQEREREGQRQRQRERERERQGARDVGPNLARGSQDLKAHLHPTRTRGSDVTRSNSELSPAQRLAGRYAADAAHIGHIVAAERSAPPLSECLACDSLQRELQAVKRENTLLRRAGEASSEEAQLLRQSLLTRDQECVSLKEELQRISSSLSIARTQAQEAVSVCLHACMLACLHACMLACLRACVLACLRACVLACLRACVPACLLCLDAFMQRSVLSRSQSLVLSVPVCVCVLYLASDPLVVDSERPSATCMLYLLYRLYNTISHSLDQLTKRMPAGRPTCLCATDCTAEGSKGGKWASGPKAGHGWAA